MYKVKYLPISLRDLRDSTDYVTDIRKAPKAALDFIEKLLSIGIFLSPMKTRLFILNRRVFFLSVE